MTTAAHPSELALDRGGAAVEAHLAACETCRARAARAREAINIFEQQVFPATWPKVRERLEARRRARWPLWLGLPALATIGVLLLVRARQPEGTERSSASAGAYVGTKGSSTVFPPGIEVHVKRGDAVFPLERGQRVRAGDALRFVYRGDRPRHLELRIVGAGGAQELFHPAPGPVPAVVPGEEIPGAAVVDAMPGAEEIVVRVSDRPFRTEDPAVGQSKIRVEKE